jgi:hypothetical protein
VHILEIVTLSKNDENLENSILKWYTDDVEDSDSTIELFANDMCKIGTAGGEKKTNFLEELHVPCNPEPRTGRNEQNMCPSMLLLKNDWEGRSRAVENGT